MLLELEDYCTKVWEEYRNKLIQLRKKYVIFKSIVLVLLPIFSSKKSSVILTRYIVNVVLFYFQIIKAAFGCLSNDKLPQECVHECLIALWNALAEYLAPEYTPVIWSILIVRFTLLDTWAKSMIKVEI